MEPSPYGPDRFGPESTYAVFKDRFLPAESECPGGSGIDGMYFLKRLTEGLTLPMRVTIYTRRQDEAWLVCAYSWGISSHLDRFEVNRRDVA